MGRLKKSFTTYVEPEQLDELNALSERTKVPKAVYVREALDYVIKLHAADGFGEPKPEPN